MRSVTRRSTLAMLAAVGVAPKVRAETKPKIAFVLRGSSDVPGWDYEHARAIEMARKELGDRVQIDQFDSVPEWGMGDLGKFNELIAKDYKMIFGCSYGYIQSMMLASFAAPDVKFELCDGYVQSGNLASYSARCYQGRVVEGILAANATQSNKIGYIASTPSPLVLRGINAAFLAARQVNPKVEFQIVWLNTQSDPDSEAAAARQLVADGADILMQSTYSIKPMEVAQELGVSAFGQSSDMGQYGPDAQLSAIISNWGPYYTDRIRSLLDGAWKPEDTWNGMAEGMIAMGKFSDSLSSRAILQAEDAVTNLRNGTRKAFVGPVRRQDGSGWLAAGEEASDSDLLTMDFFVEGIQSTIPA